MVARDRRTSRRPRPEGIEQFYEQLAITADDIAQIIAFALMIMSTFAESYDVAGKTVHPVTTYAMSGLGTGPDDYAQTCRGARIVTGLAVRGEQVRSGGTAAVDAWLRRTGLLSRR